MRLLFLLALPLFSLDLSHYEKSFYSTHGEDGILAKIFHSIPSSGHRFVEIGCGNPDAFGSPTYLLKRQGWISYQFDRYYEHREFVTAENVNSLFRSYNIPPAFDLLFLRLKHNGYHIWNALAPSYRPSLVVVRYNPAQTSLSPYRAYYTGDGDPFYGAGLSAFTDLARAKGYTLLYADSSSNHLFFLRNDLSLKE